MVTFYVVKSKPYFIVFGMMESFVKEIVEEHADWSAMRHNTADERPLL